MSHAEHHGRSDQRRAAARRLADAKALLRSAGLHRRGAMYLAGYAVECKLKAIAMESVNVWTLADLARRWRVDDREVYQHGLEALVKRLPLYHRLQRSVVWRDFASHVNRWRPSWRYNPSEPVKNDRRDEAEDFMDAVERVYRWLESNQ